MNAAIEVENLTKTYRVPIRRPGLKGAIKHLFARQYRNVVALDRISFTVQQGAAVGYLGPNGAGKTTTLKVLSGLLHPDEGRIRVLGFDPWRHEESFKKRIGFVMGQKGQLWWDLPAYDSFELLREMYEIPSRRFLSTLQELVERFSVEDLLYVPVRNLSLGERMKMELIAILLHEPQVLFLDEPTIGLDVMAQHEIRLLLKDYQKRHGATLLLASHYMRDVEDLCDRILLIHQGNILFDGSIDEIKKHYVPFKKVSFTLSRPVESEEVFSQWGEVQEYSGSQVTLTVAEHKVTQIMQLIVTRFPVVGVSVQDPSLEEVIRVAFSTFDNGQGGRDGVA
ncbi:MAG TPA: ATP-binding cassette domain-containing protein [Gammaproteobacteria bacterium]|nr:ATP-binding cassette domain-containing protein [Gammaproteobacteria bacterium]